jgi:RNA polymerase sigma-70 factor (ECF subfamily)
LVVAPLALLGANAGELDAVGLSAEALLVNRARRMDSAAWDELFAMHQAAIYRYAFFRLRDQQVAEDLASEVFLEAVRGMRRYEYRGVSFRAWLYGIAHNLVADQRRRLANRTGVEADITGNLSEPSEGDFAGDVANRRDIAVALERLTDEQQQVVVLRFFEGLSLAETASAMGRRDGAIKALQHRALARLRTILGEGC